jgi:hypothetical protein
VKNIGKLKSLNATSVKIAVRDNDKIRLATNKTKLDLMRNLLKSFVNSDGCGFTVDPLDVQVMTFRLHKNNSKHVNREVFWRSIAQCSRNNQQWQQLFD